MEQLRTLSAVIETGSLEAAAAGLQLTASAVSQRLKAMELQAGSVLVVRTRPVRATASGEILLTLARQVLLLGAEAEAALVGPESDVDPGRVHVTVAVNADSLASWFGAALSGLARETGLSVEILREDEEHASGLLRSGSVMGAVTTKKAPVQGCSSTRLGVMRYRAMANPEFAERWFGSGSDPASIAGAPAVHFDRNDSLQTSMQRMIAREIGLQGLVFAPAFYVPDSRQYVNAVVLGLGWGMVPDVQDPADGSLVRLNPGWEHSVTLYWQRWKLESAALDRITKVVLDAAAEAGLDGPNPKLNDG
ncbi:LysR family transcriptional regulator ArgP [Paeniglutamicibacter cryotolerans]|nr:LysR family transcriptional regulator ArgP [Paeniglutamicibacter cryotolerans]